MRLMISSGTQQQHQWTIDVAAVIASGTLVVLSGCGEMPHPAQALGTGEVHPSLGVTAPTPMISLAPPPEAGPASANAVSSRAIELSVAPSTVHLPIASPDAPRATTSFATWLAGFRQDALIAGISPHTLDTVLAGIRPDPHIIAVDRHVTPARPSSHGHVQGYLARHVTASLVANGRLAKAQNQSALRAAETRFGVPAEVILAIWGQETHYGTNNGQVPVITALASLAYDGRRAPFFRGELLAALRLIEQGVVAMEDWHGSWAGAFGQAQFLPSAYLAYAVDGDGDGRADIRTNNADVIASIANYLHAAGWTAGAGWGVAVRLPSTFNAERYRTQNERAECPRVFARQSAPRSIAAWRVEGLQLKDTNDAWPSDSTEARLLQPDGDDGPAYLIFPNYRAILAYNCSNYYALSVLELADALR